MRYGLVLLLALGMATCLASADTASAMTRQTSVILRRMPVEVRQDYRNAIRAMPLLERPNRPGHFYGNTVRRIHHRRMRRLYYGG